MALYPLMFSFSQPVQGSGFAAHVHGDGRAIVEFEDGEWWCSGVAPGSLTASGTTPAEAYVAFRSLLRQLLEDLAAEAGSYDYFVRDARALLDTVNRPNARQWEEALDALQSGKLKPAHGVEKFERRKATKLEPIAIERLERMATLPEGAALPKAA